MTKTPRTYPSLAIMHCLFKKALKLPSNSYFFSGSCGAFVGLTYTLMNSQEAIRTTELSRFICLAKFWWYIPVGILGGLILAWLHKQVEIRS